MWSTVSVINNGVYLFDPCRSFPGPFVRWKTIKYFIYKLLIITNGGIQCNRTKAVVGSALLCPSGSSGWLVITLPVAVGWEFVRLHPGQYHLVVPLLALWVVAFVAPEHNPFENREISSHCCQSEYSG